MTYCSRRTTKGKETMIWKMDRKPYRTLDRVHSRCLTATFGASPKQATIIRRISICIAFTAFHIFSFSISLQPTVLEAICFLFNLP